MRITHGQHAAEVNLRGGRVLTYEVAGVPVLSPLDLPDSAYRSSLLAPWPNRIAHGRWTWEGEQLQVPVNELPLGTALHGLVHSAPFVVTARGEAIVTMQHDLAPSLGYPFALRVEASYALGDDGLVCALSATNTGDRPAPVALGTHPYLDTRGPVDDTVLTIPADRVVEGDEQWEETGRPRVDGTSWDFRGGRRIGDEDIDACWSDLTGTACRLTLPGGDWVEMWGGETCRYVVVYDCFGLTGDLHRAAIAVEPNTAPANAFRSGHDLDVLAPGETLTLDWGLRASWA